VPEGCAVALLRIVIPYRIGFALAQLSRQSNIDSNCDAVSRIGRISVFLSPDASDDVVRTAPLMCGD
jgi:hypothetical protein